MPQVDSPKGALFSAKTIKVETVGPIITTLVTLHQVGNNSIFNVWERSGKKKWNRLVDEESVPEAPSPELLNRKILSALRATKQYSDLWRALLSLAGETNKE